MKFPGAGILRRLFTTTGQQQMYQRAVLEENRHDLPESVVRELIAILDLGDREGLRRCRELHSGISSGLAELESQIRRGERISEHSSFAVNMEDWSEEIREALFSAGDLEERFTTFRADLGTMDSRLSNQESGRIHVTIDLLDDNELVADDWTEYRFDLANESSVDVVDIIAEVLDNPFVSVRAYDIPESLRAGESCTVTIEGRVNGSAGLVMPWRLHARHALSGHRFKIIQPVECWL